MSQCELLEVCQTKAIREQLSGQLNLEQIDIQKEKGNLTKILNNGQIFKTDGLHKLFSYFFKMTKNEKYTNQQLLHQLKSVFENT